ncbi:TonB-dependent receptor Fiu [Cronobacter sakazakii]|nr:TonB-dependent receptor Fiu [Cronobacter sakazakii]
MAAGGSLKYALTDAWNVYASYGRGFETPTINELSYRSNGQSGLNFALKPSTSDTVEIGSKTRINNGLLTAALFRTDTDNEIVVDESVGSGRSSYKNAGKTRRQGVELALDQQFGDAWKLKAAWTYLDATYRTYVCQKGDCNGNRMPGIARNMLYTSFGYEPETGWYAGGNVRYMSSIMANDANTDKASSYTTVASTPAINSSAATGCWMCLVVSITCLINRMSARLSLTNPKAATTSLRRAAIMALAQASATASSNAFASF